MPRTSPASGRSAQKRLQRERHAAGLVHIQFWTDEADLAAKLEAAGVLDPCRSDDRAALSDATRRLVESLRTGVARDITR